jgi:hypothetical protein
LANDLAGFLAAAEELGFTERSAHKCGVSQTAVRRWSSMSAWGSAVSA